MAGHRMRGEPWVGLSYRLVTPSWSRDALNSALRLSGTLTEPLCPPVAQEGRTDRDA